MTTLAQRYRAIISHKIFYLQLATGILLMMAVLVFNYYANNYTAGLSGTSVSDVILDNISFANVEVVFLEGFMAFLAIVILLGFHKPARIPFLLKASALFIGVRAIFIMLTHLAPPANELIIHTANFLEKLIAGSDAGLFFSGHTGFPFLMALIFWNHKYLRWLFLAASLFFGGTVLLGHLHYSIDVFSAFFITYGISNIAHWLFKEDYNLFINA
jgi:hypothetical protein